MNVFAPGHLPRNFNCQINTQLAHCILFSHLYVCMWTNNIYYMDGLMHHILTLLHVCMWTNMSVM